MSSCGRNSEFCGRKQDVFKSSGAEEYLEESYFKGINEDILENWIASRVERKGVPVYF